MASQGRASWRGWSQIQEGTTVEYTLNPSQREAVTSTEGFVRVIAGAGSGKTNALTHRFAYLVNELGILPENILCVTFTNKAAKEMRQRIHNLTGDNDTGIINTFHGFCVSVLQEDSYAVSYPSSFLVLDNSDIDAMLGLIYEERGLTLRDMTFANARNMIEIEKLFKKPDYYRDMLDMDLEVLHRKYEAASTVKDIIFYGYLYQEKKCFGLDYNDLIIVTLHIFRQQEDIRLKWQKRLAYIMIDEFQDIDSLQYELMEQLCAYHGNLFIVGDPDQTIYTWRGADVKYLLEFDSHFPGTKTIMMMENYRSTPEILAAANSLIEKNLYRVKKNLLPRLPSGESVLCHHAKDNREEAEWIAAQIEQLHEQGTAFRDMTVLYRAHYVSRALEEVLVRRKVPYAIYSGVQFFDRLEIKDALSYLRMIVYKDDLSFRRVVNSPKRNIGKRRMQFLEQASAESGCSLYQALVLHLEDELFQGTGAESFVALIERYASDYAGRSVSEVLAGLLNESGYEMALRTAGSQERLDNLAELKQAVYEFETTCGEEATLENYIIHTALYTSSDREEAGDKVRLMTVHAAKGLEFPYVFLCGLNEGIFPSRRTKTRPAMEEERRLAFVAFTRAEKRLFLSEAEGRNTDGSPRYPSRFLLDIDPGCLEYTAPPQEGLIAEARQYVASQERYLAAGSQTPMFAVGDRIVHEILGPGTVMDLDAGKGFYHILFDGMRTPRDISFRVKIRKAQVR